MYENHTQNTRCAALKLINQFHITKSVPLFGCHIIGHSDDDTLLDRLKLYRLFACFQRKWTNKLLEIKKLNKKGLAKQRKNDRRGISNSVCYIYIAIWYYFSYTCVIKSKNWQQVKLINLISERLIFFTRVFEMTRKLSSKRDDRDAFCSIISNNFALISNLRNHHRRLRVCTRWKQSA